MSNHLYLMNNKNNCPWIFSLQIDKLIINSIESTYKSIEVICSYVFTEA